MRIAIGPKDLEKQQVELARRDTLKKVLFHKINLFGEFLLCWKKFSRTLFAKALRFRDEHITEVDSFDEFKEVLENKGGFIAAHWDGTAATEEAIKQANQSDHSLYPLWGERRGGSCVFTAENPKRVLFAKAY